MCKASWIIARHSSAVNFDLYLSLLAIFLSFSLSYLGHKLHAKLQLSSTVFSPSVSNCFSIAHIRFNAPNLIFFKLFSLSQPFTSGVFLGTWLDFGDNVHFLFALQYNFSCELSLVLKATFAPAREHLPSHQNWVHTCPLFSILWVCLVCGCV